MEFEIKIIKSLQSLRTPFLDGFFETISHLSNYIGFVFVFFVFLIFVEKKYALTFGITYGFSILLNNVLKFVIGRPRPYVVSNEILNLLPGGGKSMPSGHTLSATIICCFLLYYFLKTLKKFWQKPIVCVILTGFIVCVILSRMYLGQHYLTDTIAGFCLGIATSTIGILILIKGKKEGQNGNK